MKVPPAPRFRSRSHCGFLRGAVPTAHENVCSICQDPGAEPSRVEPQKRLLKARFPDLYYESSHLDC